MIQWWPQNGSRVVVHGITKHFQIEVANFTNNPSLYTPQSSIKTMSGLHHNSIKIPSTFLQTFIDAFYRNSFNAPSTVSQYIRTPSKVHEQLDSNANPNTIQTNSIETPLKRTNVQKHVKVITFLRTVLLLLGEGGVPPIPTKFLQNSSKI